MFVYKRFCGFRSIFYSHIQLRKRLYGSLRSPSGQEVLQKCEVAKRLLTNHSMGRVTQTENFKWKRKLTAGEFLCPRLKRVYFSKP